MTDVLNRLEELDRAASLAINTSSNAFTDLIMPIASKIETWIPLYALVMALFIWKMGWKKALIIIFALVLNVILADQLANLFKNTICRLRPCYDEQMLNAGLQCISSGGLYGFYSGHASNVFSFATCSILCLFNVQQKDSLKKKTKAIDITYTIIIILWAFLVSISRVYLGKHFLGDITIGAISGIITGTAIAILAILISKRG